jgi:hypothetical protein
MNSHANGFMSISEELGRKGEDLLLGENRPKFHKFENLIN